MFCLNLLDPLGESCFHLLDPLSVSRSYFLDSRDDAVGAGTCSSFAVRPVK